MSLLLDPRRYLSICGLQIQTISDIKLNLDAAEKMMRANPGHDLYVLPELSSAGYGVDTFLTQGAEEAKGPVEVEL